MYREFVVSGVRIIERLRYKLHQCRLYCPLDQKNFEAIEREKKRAYNHRILQLEHGSFSPLVFSVYGGSGRETEHVIRTLSYKISRKRKIEYSQVVNWFRTKISKELVRGAILCIRGSRDWRTSVYTDIDNIELAEYL